MAKTPKQPDKKTPQTGQPGLFDSGGGWQDKAIDTFQRFLRYGWDLLGILLFAAAGILLLGLVGITQGALISPLTTFLSKWLGLGRFLLVAAMVVIGLQVIRWRKHPPEKVALGQILGYEFASFLLLGILSLIDGGSITEAEAGNDLGGLVGWGISEIFRAAIGPTFAFLVLVILFGLSLVGALALIPKLEKAVQKRLGSVEINHANEMDQVYDAPTVVISEPER